MIPFLLSAFLMAGDVAAATPAPATSEPVTAEAPKKERKICKRDVVSTSLHGSKRTCMTALEWKMRERNATLEDMGGVTTK